MQFKWINLAALLLIIIIGGFLRFYQIESIPGGLNIDESSEGYNAFSIINTGKDRYGEPFPILFRSFGSYQAPLYTYLTVLPVYFFGSSILAVRFVSAMSGIILIIITLLLMRYFNRQRMTLVIISALVVAMSPWAVFFSRIGTEASLGVTLFGLSLLIFYLSLSHFWLFPVASLVLGLSTHAYYSERLIGILFLLGFILLFKKVFSAKKRILFLGLIFFAITQIPHLMIINSGAFTRRADQVSYFSEQSFQENSGQFRSMPFGKYLFVSRKFLSQYISYFSPRNLFFDPDPQTERSIPDLSVFYNWMLIPILFGSVVLFKRKSAALVKMILLTIIIAPIPAALTGDPFYTLRTLILLWLLSIVISIGVDDILNRISKLFTKYSLSIFLVFYSGITLYSAYFVLLKYEREVFDYVYVKLLDNIRSSSNQKFIVDSSRQLSNGIRLAYFEKYDPSKLQKKLMPQIAGQYYNNNNFDEPYILDNVEIRSIIWKKDAYTEEILVGDLLAISDSQVKEHYLRWLFDIRDRAGNIALKAYMTDPESKCKSIAYEEKIKIKDCQKY